MYRSLVLIAMAVALSISPDVGAQVLATGRVTIQPFEPPDIENHPNFNTAVTRRHTIPLNFGSTVGAELVLSLRDVNRPGQTCPEPSPGPVVLQAGCVTVDWPFEDRRSINLITFDTPAGPVTRYLRLDDTLSATREPETR